MRPPRTALCIAAAAVLALAAGCGSDSSGDDTSPSISIASPTSPLQTTTAPAATTTAPKQKGGGQTSANGGTGAAACDVPDAFTQFSYDGISCSVAVSVATAWDQNGDDCNTVDNPDVPEGFKKTCTVNGYACLAKRDVHSDGRFVTCSTGAATVRFKWLPA
jgi:hypothetical protein